MPGDIPLSHRIGRDCLVLAVKLDESGTQADADDLRAVDEPRLPDRLDGSDDRFADAMILNLTNRVRRA